MNSHDNKTKLERKFAFWYRISDDALLQQTKPLNQNEYETQVKKIAEFETVRIIFEINFFTEILGRRFLGYFSTFEKTRFLQGGS
jgi:hypothetical protein